MRRTTTQQKNGQSKWTDRLKKETIMANKQPKWCPSSHSDINGNGNKERGFTMILTISNVWLYSGLARVWGYRWTKTHVTFWEGSDNTYQHSKCTQFWGRNFRANNFPYWHSYQSTTNYMYRKPFCLKKYYKIGLNMNIQQREKVTKITFTHTMEHYAISTKNEG